MSTKKKWTDTLTQEKGISQGWFYSIADENEAKNLY
jgi:hypothetical protein